MKFHKHTPGHVPSAHQHLGEAAAHHLCAGQGTEPGCAVFAALRPPSAPGCPTGKEFVLQGKHKATISFFFFLIKKFPPSTCCLTLHIFFLAILACQLQASFSLSFFTLSTLPETYALG